MIGSINKRASEKRLIADALAVGTIVPSTQLPMATTTEVLTGTAINKVISPDALAALWEQGTDNAGGATITLGEGRAFTLITSTTAITAFVFTTDKIGRIAFIKFNTARVLTHNATSLILPNERNLTTVVGDTCVLMSLGGGNFMVIEYTRKNGLVINQSGDLISPFYGATTRVFGIGDGDFSAGKTGIFRFSDTFNQISNTHGGPNIYQAFHGHYIKNNVGDVARFGQTADVNSYFYGRLGIKNTAPLADFHNSGSTLFASLAVSNLASGGAIGTAAATVDIFTFFDVNQTTLDQTLTIPTPTNTTKGRFISIANVGTASFIIGGFLIAPRTAIAFTWTGSFWSIGIVGGTKISLLDPTVNSDGANTDGNGYFIPGMRWLNTDTGVEYFCIENTTGAAIWSLPEKYSRIFDDFTGQTSDSFSRPDSSGTGSGGDSEASMNNNQAFGLVRLNTGTTTTGRGGRRTSSHFINNGKTSVKVRARIETALADVTENFVAIIGYSGAADGTEVNAIYFRYNYAVNSGKWECVCRAASVETVVDSGVTANLSDNTFQIRINAAGTSVRFYISGTLVATITTNIPTATQMQFYFFNIRKTAGTTNRTAIIDYFDFIKLWTTGR